MTTGKSNEFPIVINRKAIADIADAIETGSMIFQAGIQYMIQAGAPRKDIQVGLTLLAVQKWMEAQRVQPDFKVEFK